MESSILWFARQLGRLAHSPGEVHNNTAVTPSGPSVLAVGGLVWITCYTRRRHDEASYVQRSCLRWSAARVVGSSVPRPGGAVGRYYRQGHGERGRAPGRGGGDDRGAGRRDRHGDV